MKIRALGSILTTLALMGTLCGGASAYRLINTPTADTLSPGDLRLEGESAKLDPGSISRYRVDFGLKGALELQVKHDVLAGDSTTMLGLEKKLIPETGLTPSISVGVINITDAKKLGRSAYAVASMTIPLINSIPLLPVHDIRVHAGVGNGSFEGTDFARTNKDHLGVFAGAEVGLPLGLGVQAENDSHGFNFAATWSFGKLVKFRAMSLRGDRAYSVIVTPAVF